MHYRDHKERLQSIKKQLKYRNGQEDRAASSFALIALAGELATEYDLTGWSAGEATAATIKEFNLWIENRTSDGSEQQKIIKAVQDFILRHGDSRFSYQHDPNPSTIINNRAGWYNDGEHRKYMFTTQGLEEALKGFNFRSAIKVLVENGIVVKQKDGKNQNKTPIKATGERPNLYWVDPLKLEAFD